MDGEALSAAPHASSRTSSAMTSRTTASFQRCLPRASPTSTVAARAGSAKKSSTLPLRHAETRTWIDRYEAATALLPCVAYQPLNLAQ